MHHSRALARRPLSPDLMREWQKSLAAGIRAMQRNGHLPLSLNLDEAAAALLAGIQGGVSIMLSTGQSTHALMTATDETFMSRLSSRSLVPVKKNQRQTEP